ncbi:hypothetical protein TEA_027908 [Camellia sinensis var. sinensis]|uniref:P-type ATPase C-terminal domain-containing protein n=1 Tax=Camellia sinensis var. sinensis TaxID=542762 RepID=A0A4S4DGG6_CAMSN|nr:hypothetical protein TEA_027908 [Camellia sinensis var. sinensis]
MGHKPDGVVRHRQRHDFDEQTVIPMVTKDLESNANQSERANRSIANQNQQVRVTSRSVSGTSLLDAVSLMAYNVFYTSIPVLVSLVDKDLSEGTVMQHPQILYYCQAGRLLNPRTFAGWFGRSLFHVFFCFFGIHMFDSGFITFKVPASKVEFASSCHVPLACDFFSILGHPNIIIITGTPKIVPYTYQVLTGCRYAYRYGYTRTGYGKNQSGTSASVGYSLGTAWVRLRGDFDPASTLVFDFDLDPRHRVRLLRLLLRYFITLRGLERQNTYKPQELDNFKEGSKSQGRMNSSHQQEGCPSDKKTKMYQIEPPRVKTLEDIYAGLGQDW